jgi:hypothetical protein
MLKNIKGEEIINEKGFAEYVGSLRKLSETLDEYNYSYGKLAEHIKEQIDNLEKLVFKQDPQESNNPLMGDLEGGHVEDRVEMFENIILNKPIK